jgi:hypothetical protein
MESKAYILPAPSPRSGLRTLLACLILTLGVPPTVAWANPEEQDLPALIEASRAAVARADQAGYQWRDSADLLREAERALADGQPDLARDLATRALFQGEAAYRQWQDQSEAGPGFAPRGDAQVLTGTPAEQLAAAEAAIGRAASVGYEWRDSRALLEAARLAEERGDAVEAGRLAGLAHRQGDSAYSQWRSQQNAGPRF